MFYLDEAKGLGDLLWAIIPDIKGIIQMAIVAVITWLVSRPKTQAEIHKTTAEADHTKASTVQLLLDEIDALIEKVRLLRNQIERMGDKRGAIRRDIRKIITLAQILVEDLKGTDAAQTIKMQGVRILESLYSVKEKLKPSDDEEPD